MPRLPNLPVGKSSFESIRENRNRYVDKTRWIHQMASRGLLRGFEALLREAQSSKKKIKEVRKQAVLFGFEDCYRKQRYQDILLLARRLHPSILENDSELSEFAEIAEVKVEGM